MMRHVLLVLFAFATLATAQRLQVHRQKPCCPSHGCLSPAEHRVLERLSAAGTTSPSQVPQFLHYPVAGNPETDIPVSHYVDLDASSGLRDWNCTRMTYDGHNGIDTSLRSFGYQDAGIPVYAILDGKVTSAVDGHFDRHTRSSNVPGNQVTIDHGNGLVTIYAHLKKNSVLVKRDQVVAAGQQIGMVGSSGRSSGPHLHLGVYVNGKAVEPFVGRCNSRAALWRKRPDFGLDFRLRDIGVSRVSPTSVGKLEQYPGGGWLNTTDKQIYVWTQMSSIPASSTYRLVFKRPNDSTFSDTGNQPYFDRNFVASTRAYFARSFGSPFGTPGTWKVQFYMNGKMAAEVPFVVSATAPSNRRPAEVQAAMDPAKPKTEDAVYCRLRPQQIRDLDYEIVRYRYRWTVNNQIVRDVTHAGEADALARDKTKPGDRIACTVTPTDGKLSARSVTASAIVDGGPAQPDLAVTAFSTTPGATWNAGGRHDFSATIKNVGGATAHPTTLVVLLSKDATITTQDDDMIGTYAVGSLASNASQTVRDFFTGTTCWSGPGVFYLGAYADGLRRLTEADESNNGRSIATPRPLRPYAGPGRWIDYLDPRINNANGPVWKGWAAWKANRGLRARICATAPQHKGDWVLLVMSGNRSRVAFDAWTMLSLNAPFFQPVIARTSPVTGQATLGQVIPPFTAGSKLTTYVHSAWFTPGLVFTAFGSNSVGNDILP